MTNDDVLSVGFLPEPLLEFGFGQATQDPREGLFLYGPLIDERKPVAMRIGVIGCPAGLLAYRKWVQKIRGFIPKPELDNFHQFAFPGFESAFRTIWPEAPVTEILISATDVANSIRLSDRPRAIHETVSLFANAINKKRRDEAVAVDVWFIIIPDDVFMYGRPLSRVPAVERIEVVQTMTNRLARKLQQSPSLFPEDMVAAETYLYGMDFHNQLKARLLPEKITTQIVRESSLEQFYSVTSTRGRRMQDPASVAWNICTAAFYKACGTPWKLSRVRKGVCYLGLVFKKSGSAADDRNACCGAQMFLESGEGVVFKGALGPWYSPSTGEFHLSRSAAMALMKAAADAYEEEHSQPPSEIFIHGQTFLNKEEWQGFLGGVSPSTKLVGVRIRRSGEIKLFRPGTQPVIRGTVVFVSDRKAFLWTSGFVSTLDTYAGREVPNPLSIEIVHGDADMPTVLEDIMCLTKLNFNSCMYSDGLPVTLRFASTVGEIIVSAPIGVELPPLPFRHYI